jgi:hypothetical protein
MLAIRTVLGASLVLAMTALGIAACSSDETKPPAETGDHLDYCDLPTVCQEIVAACHQKDDGEDEESQIHKCHETGHDVGTEEACAPIHDDCIAVCDDAPLPPGATAEPPEECGDGGHDH